MPKIITGVDHRIPILGEKIKFKLSKNPFIIHSKFISSEIPAVVLF